MDIQTLLSVLVTGALGAFIYGFVKNKKTDKAISDQIKVDQIATKIEVLKQEETKEEATEQAIIDRIQKEKKDVGHEELVSFFNDYLNSANTPK